MIHRSYFFILILFFTSITSCAAKNSYENGKYSCKGHVHALTKIGGQDYPDETIAMSVEGNHAYFSGSNIISNNEIKICPPGSNDFAKQDEMYFDTSGCGTSNKALKRQYGTYNFITNTLNISNDFESGLVSHMNGEFNCAKK